MAVRTGSQGCAGADADADSGALSGWRRREALASLLACGSAAAAWVRPAQAAGSARRVTLGTTQEPSSLDPTMDALAAVGGATHYNILEGLTRIEESGSVAPLLAEHWSASDDGLHYRFHLRQGVYFHDGSALAAQAVRFSFERAAAPGSTNKARKALFANMARIEARGTHQIDITLHHADAQFLFHLGENTAVILHPDSAGQAATQPVGTGPYRLDRWTKGHSLRLVRAPHHDRGTPQIEEGVFRFITDPDQQAAALDDGELDFLFQFATPTVQRFERNAGFQLLVGASSGKAMLALNNRRKPLDDARVRRALTHAIDRESLIRQAFGGRGVPIGSHFAPTDPGYLHLESLYPYNPETARALLAEAGVRTPLRLQLALPPTPYAVTGAPLLAHYLAAVGIRVEPVPMTWAQWLAGPFKGDFDMTFINHVEPLDYLIYTDPAYYFHYDSSAFRALVARHATSTNARERQQLFARIQRFLAHDAVNAWIYTPQVGTVARKGLRGAWVNYPIVAHDLAAMWWE
ncbi:ABC transporter substrate-binding protein [Comamonas badia]|uniref:ABC transporter substrate-binding protein n=1 Tax=Comamonas badia TaxID=265291 RepID=UPI000463E283|nr:ABC transporter substrate-binding protein [Comamonas badia]